MSQTPPPPPPPPGGYGSPPPPPEGYGYGGPPAGTPPYSVGTAVGYGWSKFQAHAGQIVIAGLIVFGGIVVLEVLGTLIQRLLLQGGGLVISLLGSAITSFLFFLAYQVIGAGIIRGALGITEGREFRFDEVLKTDKLGPVVVTSLITSAIVFVGTLLCFLPGIIASFLLSFSLYFVIDRDLAPMDAIRASVELVTQNLGEALVW